PHFDGLLLGFIRLIPHPSSGRVRPSPPPPTSAEQQGGLVGVVGVSGYQVWNKIVCPLLYCQDLGSKIFFCMLEKWFLLSKTRTYCYMMLFLSDGSEIPASTLMEILLMNDFKLVINKITYDVQCPRKEKLSMEHAAEMDSVKSLVHRLFTALHLEEFQKKREHHLLERIDHLKGQLQPLEQVKAGIEARSEAKTSGLLWAGLALLSVQGGALAWLTWWVYSWDIMEPVTYFITFANSMVFFAYFIVTRQDYTYSAVKSRQFLHFFHKKSKRQHFDVVRYNKLKEDLAKATESLKQVRHSLSLRMQGEELSEKN
uniref:Calcium uniporter regulatory subunit MCUb n=1 Tax=Ursus americanus TaxID=9643 RepID=A0A452SI00_URSAM